MLAAEVTSANYSGMPDDVKSHLTLLTTFKAAASYLGMGPRVINTIDWLFQFTQPQDWTSTSRPIVWPSSALQADELGIKASQVKNLNRQLVSLGLVVMRDSPNGKRYGHRNKEGRILTAYGFDLSPLAVRFDEFKKIAAIARSERQRLRDLKRRASIARNSIKQTIAAMEDLVGEQFDAEERNTWEKEISARMTPGTDLTAKVENLETLASKARERLTLLIEKPVESVTSPVESGPNEPQNWPHKYSYNLKNLSRKDTVSAMGKGLDGDRAKPPYENVQAKEGAAAKADEHSCVKITPRELVRLAPRLATYIRSSRPSWNDVVDAADWLRHELEIDNPLWGSACLVMGREIAAVTCAIISTKPKGYFKKGAGNYFYGMVRKSNTGELNLNKTIWGIRKNINAHIS
jgi:replication initiation protein RepC